jgi:hypothetical protein
VGVFDRSLPSRWSGASLPKPSRLRRPAVAPATFYAPVCPLWSRLFDAVPLSPVAVGAILGGVLALAFFALDLLDGNLASLLGGDVAPWLHVEVRSAVVVSALLAGVLSTHRYEELGTRRDLEKLSPLLRSGALRRSSEQALAAAPGARALRGVGLIGALMIAGIVPMLYVDPTRFLRVQTYALPSVLFDLAIGAVLGFTTFKTLFGALAEDRRFALLARDLGTIDLLDLSPLYVFGRRGLRRALRWLLLVSIASLVFFDAGRAAPPALMLSAIFGFALLSFLLPVWGAHRSIRAEKGRELEHLHGRIAEQRRCLQANDWRPAEAGGRFADLLAYEARVSAARTWPFDAPTLARLALYGCLPVGSWLGSALIQHVVDGWLR